MQRGLFHEVARQGDNLRFQGVACPHNLVEERLADLAREVQIGEMDDGQAFQGWRQTRHVEAALGQVQVETLVARQMDQRMRVVGRCRRT